jgi:hypothetical protein
MDLMQHLQDKYPEMKPVTKPPGMATVNGIGTMLYGSRDFDPESGTYVKTHCATLLYIPVLVLGAYRVADAPQGWYFLGKVPLSVLARGWNWLVLASIFLGAGIGLYYHHANQPDTIAANRLAQGDELAAAGKLGQAARLFQGMGLKEDVHGGQARARLAGLLDGPIDQAGADDVTEVFRVAVDVHKLTQEPAQVFARAWNKPASAGKTRPRTPCVY